MGLNPRLFIGGCPRSGTTLLQRMLNHHPQLAIANDTHFIPRALSKVRSLNGHLTSLARQGLPVPLHPELQRQVWDYHRFYRLGIEREQFDQIADKSTTYQELVAGLFDEFARSAGKSMAGEKTPDYVKHVPELLGLFPQAIFVNIVRDGRNVALSLMDWATPEKGPGRLAYWRVDPLAVSALWWSGFVQHGKQASQRHASHFTNVRYEQLVADPQPSLQEICALVQLDYDDRMLDYHVGKQQTSNGLSAKKQWLPPTSGLRDWRQTLSKEDVDVFHCLVGVQLRELGYEVPDSKLCRPAVKRAAKARAWWCSFVNSPIEVGS